MGSLSVLIAEDDAVSRRILQRAVEQYGHTCLAAADGQGAWAQFQRQPVDVVISDWVMPGYDGPALCELVRGHSESVYTYFILLTGLTDKAHFLKGMEAGADDYLTKPFDREELQARLLAAGRVMELHRRLGQQNADLAALNQALFDSARTDPLTGLGNRLRLWEDLQLVLARAERYGHQYAVALCDVDHFKKYNDQYGHQAGDLALRTVAQSIAGCCRQGDAAYRYGGEEFLVLLPEQDRLGATIALNRIRQAVQSLGIPHAGNPIGVVTLSAGIALAERAAVPSAEALLSRADAALYEAKDAGRNRVVLYAARALAAP
jgi:two-component system chemotaxis response regulator CheY